MIQGFNVVGEHGHLRKKKKPLHDRHGHREALSVRASRPEGGAARLERSPL